MRRYSIILILLVSASTGAQTLSDILRVEQNSREALNQYTFSRVVLLQTIGPDGQVTGEYIRKSEFIFDDKGNRIEKLLTKTSTLKAIRLTDEDVEDFAGSHLLGLDNAERYSLELSEDVIEIRPRPGIAGRYFAGAAQFHPVSLRITKFRGRAEPQDGAHRYPFFETLRDERGFPVLTTADDVLRFPTKDVRVRVETRYSNYKRFGSEVTIREISSAAHWARDSRVKVYLSRVFSQSDRAVLLRAMNTWNALISEAQFVYAGTAETLQTCHACLTVLAKTEAHHRAGTFQGHGIVDGLLTYGRIEIDLEANTLEALMLHELGHSLGLADCECDGVMRATLRKGKLVLPSKEEVEMVRQGYE